MKMQRTPLAVLSLATFALTGCGIVSTSFPDSGSAEPAAVAHREEAAAEQLIALQTAAMSEPLTERVFDFCRSGERTIWVQDISAWSCDHSTAWAVPADTSDPAVLIDNYEAHLTAVGCEPDAADFGMARDYWATYGVPGVFPDGAPYTVDDLVGVSAQCGGHQVGIGFHSAGALIPDGTESTYPDLEVVENGRFDRDAILAHPATLYAVLSVTDNYHWVDWDGTHYPQPKETEAPDSGYCACYSGGTCDCPGG
jgi:hypothetical protein